MRILLIEDDPATSKSIELMLGHANFNVYTTDRGEEGIDLAKLYDYDLILSTWFCLTLMGMMCCASCVFLGLIRRFRSCLARSTLRIKCADLALVRLII